MPSVARSIVMGAVSCLHVCRALAAEPWTDAEHRDSTRHEFGDYGLSADAEYRAIWLYVNPIALNSTTQRKASWIEQRLRIDTQVDYDEKVTLSLSLDGLDGVLWGDNGTFVGEPHSNSGIRVAASNPNSVKPAVGYIGRGSNLDPENYGFVLVEQDTIELRRVWGEVRLPVGLLRIGRQPANDRMGILLASGDGRANRFGYSNDGDTSDRILFATKPLEALEPSEMRDTSVDRGLILMTFYDRTADAEVRTFGDNLQGAGVVVRFLDPQPAQRTDLEAQASWLHRWEAEFDTALNVFCLKAQGRLDRWSAGAEGVFVVGATREISEALARINADPVRRQDIRQWGARAVVRWDEPLWTAYLELDYASGDRNPNPGTDLTQLTWAEDTNVGLLMFERVLAFESARSAAAGVELLRRANATTFPAERVDTEGSFTNALALFPQVDVRPLDTILLRGGMLVAWAPSGLVDPIVTLQNRDGVEIEDDLVNFNGGRPGDFYGVELDGRFEWRYLEHFLFDLEGAILFPGNAFYDENEQAARSMLIQGRATFVF
jgi:hypothetical protein